MVYAVMGAHNGCQVATQLHNTERAHACVYMCIDSMGGRM